MVLLSERSDELDSSKNKTDPVIYILASYICTFVTVQIIKTVLCVAMHIAPTTTVIINNYTALSCLIIKHQDK